MTRPSKQTKTWSQETRVETESLWEDLNPVEALQRTFFSFSTRERGRRET